MTPLRSVVRFAAAVLALTCCAVAADLLFPPPLEKTQNVSRVVLDREGRWLHAFAAADKRWRFKANIDEVDPEFLRRLIAVEDKRFWLHCGVDGWAVLRAARSAMQSGRIVSGASTITMQTARLLEPRPRNFASKIAEMIRALQLERRLSKRQILELYLTLAPYGGNIEGVRAASLIYFGKEPVRLTDAEQALLVALPQAPEARRPDRRAKAARAARRAVLSDFGRLGLITTALEREADDASLPAIRNVFAGIGYHAAMAVLASARGDGADQRATIDLRLQQQMEALLKAHVASINDGATASLIVVDNRTRAIRALVGSSGFDAAGGWIDLTNSKRSPGSTLKPFIYGMAFDDGLAGPDTVIDDMPQSFDGYSPENFDKTFRGEVRAAEALQHSLNIPAVSLLNRLGAQKLSATLTAAGVDLKGPKRANRSFGLTLALGGAGVSLRDLAMLYAGLANGGAVSPLTLLAEEENVSPASYQLISNDSARRVSEILADGPSLEGRMPSQLTERGPVVSFKTGTSYGYRDAWSAGNSGAYTVVVWVGRADGAPRPGETGRKAAAPLLMNVFDALKRFDPDGMPRRSTTPEEAPIVLARFTMSRAQAPPEIVFPRDGVELFSGDRGIALAARGGAGGYRWFVEGTEVDAERANLSAFWRPTSPGFYQITVIDKRGRSARSRVRVAANAG
jgi:penicillin-binding protein 1C